MSSVISYVSDWEYGAHCSSQPLQHSKYIEFLMKDVHSLHLMLLNAVVGLSANFSASLILSTGQVSVKWIDRLHMKQNWSSPPIGLRCCWLDIDRMAGS